jgi:hypothetical protein
MTHALRMVSHFTAARPVCPLRCGAPDAPRQQGMTLGDIDIWIFPPAEGSQPCRLISYWKTKYNKTKSRPNAFLPLPPGPSTLFTVPILLLLLFLTRGILGTSDIESIHYPTTVTSARRLAWPTPTCE